MDSVIPIDGLLNLTCIGLLVLTGLALLVYSIASQKYWLLLTLLAIPSGLFLMAVTTYLLLSPRTIQQPMVRSQAHELNNKTTVEKDLSKHDKNRDETTAVAKKTDSNRSTYQLPDKSWSDSLPPTANIYPSLVSCGRPLAYQIANALEQESPDAQPKFSVTFSKERHPGDRTQWKPPKDFISDFQKEFALQFPDSTASIALEPTEENAEAAEADSINGEFKPLEIKLSLKPSKTTSSGDTENKAIQARWTKQDNTRALASVDYIEKPWVTNPDQYIWGKQPKRLAVGFSQRLARSPQEASTLAMQDTYRQTEHIYGSGFAPQPEEVVDRFVQKLSLPYGELWRESVLVAVDSKTNGEKLHSPFNAEESWLAPPSHSNAVSEPNASLGTITSHRHLHSSADSWILLSIMAVGMIGVGWLSNLVTQGYYRQNINSMLVVGVLVIAGLLALTFFVGFSSVDVPM